MALISCPQCGTENDANAKFCISCGTRLAGGCPVCGTVNPPDAKFCMNCGTSLLATIGAQPIEMVGAAGGTQPITERRLVSVLFVDLVGFTTASEGRDAEDTRDLLTRYYDVAREIVARYGGTIEKFIGDAVMGVWGTPTAHEDDAERAVRAGLELVSAVPRLDPGTTLQARAGVLTGEAAVAIGLEGQGMIAGDLVNTASRLQSVARPGTVLVGDATYRATNRAIAFESAGERELKGKEQPVAVWEATSVVARRGGAGRAATLEPPFVGRDDELQLLKDQFHTTAREGKPRLVTLSGIAGIGKSRLLWELEKYLDGVTQSVFLLSGRSPAYGEGISYWALAEMLRGRAGIAEAEASDVARERVQAMLERFVPDDADRRWIEPRAMGLLGLEALPTESRDELFAAWRTLIERFGAESPVVLSFADLQWADQGMFDFIEHLLNWARSSPILVLAEARPELFDRRPSWGRTVRAATVVHLGPLAEEDMRRLLAGLVPDMPGNALRRIVDRAEGVPLYAVETLRMLADRGALELEANHYRLSGPLPELSVPETLHALILSRIDALPAQERAVLSDASVLGVSFTLAALVAVSGTSEAVIAERLDALGARELLVLESDPRSPERGQFRFLQGVVREVAYQSLAKRTRQAKHLAAARYFESLGEADLAGVLATHYLSAYRAAPAGPEADALAAQARIALRAAAERATALHDLRGALTYTEDALSITTDPGEQAALHERAVPLAAETAEMARAYDHAHMAIALYVGLKDRLGVLRTKAREGATLLSEHQDQTAIALLEQALADVADLPPAAEVADAQSELARALMLAGSPDAILWSDRVLESSAVASTTVILEALITKGTALQNRGRATEAEVLLRGAAAVADATEASSGPNLFAALRARNNLRVQIMQIDLREALALTRELFDIAKKFGQRTWMIHATGASLDVAMHLGEWDAYLDDVDSEFADAPDYYRNWFASQKAWRDAFRADPTQAQAVVDAALTSELSTASKQALSWFQAMKADALIAQGRFQEAWAAAEASWTQSSEAEMGFAAGLVAGAGSGSTTTLEATRAAWRTRLVGEQLPLIRGFEQMADALVAALEQRWDDARAAYLASAKTFDDMADYFMKARLQLAVAQLVGGRYPEADTALAEASAWFGERAASAYVERYRSTAAHAEAGVPGRATSRAGADRSSPVRAAR